MQALVRASLGPQNVPVATLTLQDLNIPAFPTTTSGKVRRDKLRTIVMKHLIAQMPRSNVDENPTIPAIESNERLLVDTFANLTGQLAEHVPTETPLASLTDSINILRFHAHIRKLTNKNIAIDDVLRATSVQSLAKHLHNLPNTKQSSLATTIRDGPPTAAEMVHVQGEQSQYLRSRLVLEPLLAKLHLSWSEVEDIFPIPDVSSRSFEATRPKAYSIRLSFITRSASRSILLKALEATLQQWPMFRALAMRLDQQALFVTVRAGSKWSEAAITEVYDLGDPQDLFSLTLPDPERNSVHPRGGGPLTRFVIADIRSTGTAGLMMLSHHSVCDAISLQMFIEDIQHNLAKRPATELRTSYKLFADMCYLYSNSLPSQIAVAFHVNRLRGISSLRHSLWPRQRCVGWHIGDDEGYSVLPFSDPALSTERIQADKDGGHAGLVGIHRSARLSDLQELRFRHNISAPVLFKAACAILNRHLTQSREVLFMNTQAGRQWPFLDQSIAMHLPNPITIAGNTLATVLNRIQVLSEETVISFLSRLESEQQLLTTHAHAPTGSILSQLNPGDAAAFTAGRRQLLNWNPSLSETVSKDSQEMRLMQLIGYTEVMLEWHCGILESDLGSVSVQWDGCQLGKQEVQGCMDRFMKALVWLSSQKHWESKIGELVF